MCVRRECVLEGVWCLCLWQSSVRGVSAKRMRMFVASTSKHTRTYAMRRNWLTHVEREYVRTLLDEAIEHVKVRDREACAKYVEHAIRTRRMSTAFLSQDVINTFANKGFGIINGMLKRHAGYANLPLPLRAKALHNKAAAVGLVQRTNTVRVDASTLREECSYAETRHKMNMSDEVGRQAKHVLMVKTKRK